MLSTDHNRRRNGGSSEISQWRENRRRVFQNKKLILSLVLVSLLVHLIALALFGLWVVAVKFKKPEAAFTLSKTLIIPTQTREHKMNMAAHAAMTPKPSFKDKLLSTRPLKIPLPEMPELDIQEMMPMEMEPSELLSSDISGLIGASGVGQGANSAMSGADGMGTGMSFFGVEAQGSRILLIFDVSASVVNKAKKAGISLSRIKEETIRLIDGLPINSRFSLIQFTQNYKMMSDELWVANANNKDKASDWVESEWVTGGSMSGRAKGVVSNDRGLLEVFEKGFAMRPDLVFLISDGSIQYRANGGIETIPYKELNSSLKELQKQLDTPAALNFIGFAMKKDDRREWRKITRRNQGKLKELK